MRLSSQAAELLHVTTALLPAWAMVIDAVAAQHVFAKASAVAPSRITRWLQWRDFHHPVPDGRDPRPTLSESHPDTVTVAYGPLAGG